MARYPSAEWAPIPWMNGLRHYDKTQFTIHITAGEGDPRTIATWRNGQAGSNFVLFRDGRAVQLADSACKSAADAGATHTISVECVGANGPLTNAQVQTLIRMIRDANRLDGVPLRLAATSSDAGIGWHRLGVDGSFPHGRMGGRLQRSPLGVKTSKAFGKACPTDPVINQIHDVILPALAGGEEDEMTPDETRKLNEIHEVLFAGSKGTPKPLTVYQRVVDVQTALTKALPVLVADAKKPDGDPAAIAAAVVAAIPTDLAQSVIDGLADRLQKG